MKSALELRAISLEMFMKLSLISAAVAGYAVVASASICAANILPLFSF